VVPYTDIDSTNLKTTIVIPVGSKLLLQARVQLTSNSGNYAIALVDTSTSTVLDAFSTTQTSTPAYFNLLAVITGDGASHTISLQYALSGSGTETVIIGNNAVGSSPVYASVSAYRPAVIVQLIESN